MTTEPPSEDITQEQWVKLTRNLKQERQSSLSALGLAGVSAVALMLGGTMSTPFSRQATYAVGFASLGASMMTALGALICAHEAAAVEKEMYHQKRGEGKSWAETSQRRRELEDSHSR